MRHFNADAVTEEVCWQIYMEKGLKGLEDYYLDSLVAIDGDPIFTITEGEEARIWARQTAHSIHRQLIMKGDWKTLKALL